MNAEELTLRALRRALGMTQEQTAAALQCSRSNVARLDRCSPSLVHLARIAPGRVKLQICASSTDEVVAEMAL